MGSPLPTLHAPPSFEARLQSWKVGASTVSTSIVGAGIANCRSTVCRESQLASPASGLRGPSMRAIGVVLIVLGLFALAYGGVSWTRKDTVIDAGPLEVTKDKRETVFFPPLAGVLMLVGGAVLVLKK